MLFKDSQVHCKYQCHQSKFYMSNKEFTKQELVELLNKYEVNGKVSFDDLGQIVFDSKFPDELFQNAKEEIIAARNDERRLKELVEIFLPKAQKALVLQQEVVVLCENRLENLARITSLKKQISDLEIEIAPIEKELHEVKKRIDIRKGQ